ncbi:hypothetical protein [Leptothrix discophora]|uniref:Uncharacterized protein n=1 Tax=Leptothrix discophora TaxID=89 RepID=A0ABT9G1H4_LEPDI|nr:hypothetical protein [Leptothrix discophora]MDP4300340.1 hypothetical protein [Leptothrix discophora]
MWTFEHSALAPFAAAIAFIVVMALLGSGLGGWLILLGLVVLCTVAIRWDSARKREQEERDAFLRAFLEKHRRENGEA